MYFTLWKMHKHICADYFQSWCTQTSSRSDGVWYLSSTMSRHIVHVMPSANYVMTRHDIRTSIHSMSYGVRDHTFLRLRPSNVTSTYDIFPRPRSCLRHVMSRLLPSSTVRHCDIVPSIPIPSSLQLRWLLLPYVSESCLLMNTCLLPSPCLN